MKESDLTIIFECLHGSHAYGMATPESDRDYKGVAIAPIEYYIGFNSRFEQLEQRHPDDRVIYDIRKFFKLAADCNPNMVDVLYCDDDLIVKITPLGEKLREIRDMFISKKARFTFLGYAFAQLKRIRTHRHWLLNPPKKQPERSDFDLPEQKLLSDDHMGAYLALLSTLLRDSLEEAKLSQETLDELRNVNTVGLLQRPGLDETVWAQSQKLTGASDNFMEALHKEKQYKAAMDNWRSYQNWKKNRNTKRAAMEAEFGYDLKHSAHLIRLCRMGEEILSGKGVHVKRDDAEELLAIRNGAWSYERVEEYAEGMDRKMDELYKTSPLPKAPDRAKLDEICMELISEHFGW